jgi:hypothetical protein
MTDTTHAELITRLNNLFWMLKEEGHYTKANTARFAADRIEELSNCVAVLEAKLAKAVEALEKIDSITVHSGGEIHGVTAQHWRTAFEVAQDEATITLAELKGQDDA